MRAYPSALIALLLVAGCGKESVPHNDTTRAATTARAGESTPPNPTGPSFAAWRERLDELLPLDLAASAAGRRAEDTRPVRYHPGLTLRYEWSGGRTRAYAGMDVPTHDRIVLGVPRSGVTRAFFRSRFQPLDAAQQARLHEEVQRQARKRGLDAASTAVAQDLSAGFSERAAIEDIPGLGDDAVWELGQHGQTLHVLLNGSVITLDVDLSDDAAMNKAIAVSLANTIMARL